MISCTDEKNRISHVKPASRAPLSRFCRANLLQPAIHFCSHWFKQRTGSYDEKSRLTVASGKSPMASLRRLLEGVPCRLMEDRLRTLRSAQVA